MATEMKRLFVRASEPLRQAIDMAGPLNSATRALLWLGAASAGLSISEDGRREIARLLGDATLHSDVLQALGRLYEGIAVSTVVTVQSLPVATPTPVTTLPVNEAPRISTVAPEPEPADDDNDDPFAIGFEFDG